MDSHDAITPRAPDRPRGRLGVFHLGVLAAAIFALAFASAPWFAFRAVRAAAEAQDVQALGELVDYGAVRGGLRAQFRPTAAAQVPPPNIWEDPLGAMRRVLQQPIARPPLVEDYLTPAALARMTHGLPPIGAPVEAGAGRLPKLVYWDFRRCRLGVERPDDPTQVTVLTFARVGLFDWKLVRILLPERRTG